MQIGHMCELLGHQSPIEGVQSFHTVILVLHVGSHEVHVRSKVFEKRTDKRTAQHRYAYIRIFFGQCFHHRNNHRHVAQCRESDDQNVLSALHTHHFLLSTNHLLLFIKYRISRWIVIHLHLSVHLHHLPTFSIVFQQLVDGCRQVYLLLQ